MVNSAEKMKPVDKSEAVTTALSGLQITLNLARQLIESYTQDNCIKRIVKSGRHADGFSDVNERLTDAYNGLSGVMQVENHNDLREVFDFVNRMKQDNEDRQNDEEELKQLILEYLQKHEKHMQKQDEHMQKQDEHVQKQGEHMQKQDEQMEVITTKLEEMEISMTKMMDSLCKPSGPDVTVEMIELKDLEYDYPKMPFMFAPNAEFYKGIYKGFPVSIKQFIDNEDPSLRKIPSVFKKDVEIMKKFPSPNVLRIYGICITNEEGPNPEYLMVMEYCEMGSLRDVLDSNCDLSWITKARMCLEAARGLYRLHQTGVKSTVHGCLNSSKLLVAQGYTVKLGSFEFAQTESSLKRTKTNPAIRSVCYMSPEMINCQDCRYSKQCEIYSFGIVMWEIATRQNPFTAPFLTEKEIRAKVGKGGHIEPLLKDCPAALGDLIIACRAYESFRRPSAGVLMNRLGIVVTQLENQ